MSIAAMRICGLVIRKCGPLKEDASRDRSGTPSRNPAASFTERIVEKSAMTVLNKVKDGPHFSVDELIVNRGALVEDIRIDEIDLEDDTFSIHPDPSDTDVLLEQSLQHEGQLDPIVVRKHHGRWQLVDGFRRVRAAKRLGRDRLTARKFDTLSDSEAAMWVLKNITVDLPMPAALSALAERLFESGQGDASALVQRYAESIQVVGDAAGAIEAPAAEVAVEEDATAEEEVTLDDLTAQTVASLSGATENLQLVQENWADVGGEQREEVLAQLRYYRDLLGFLEGGGEQAREEQETTDEVPIGDDET
jgi:hypothetical protein